MFIITTPVLLLGDVYINYSRLNPALQGLFFHYGRKYLEQCIPDVMKQLPRYRLKKKITDSLFQIFLKQDSYLDIDTLINEMKRI